MANNIVSAASTFGPLIGDTSANYALIQPGVRSIGDLYPHVVVEETHNDELAITQHPVEYGTPVTDHAFLQPYTVEIRCGWSDSNAQTSGYVQAVYAAFLALQASKTPFNISTGKRQYSSMLLRTLLVKTDPDSEYTLMCVATAQHIVITNTTMSATTPANTNGSSQIGSITNNPSGVPTPQVGNGVATIPAGSVTPDAFGAMTFPNDVTGAGTQSLVPAGAGAPTAYSP
jgi:hypothetical protein